MDGDKSDSQEWTDPGGGVAYENIDDFLFFDGNQTHLSSSAANDKQRFSAAGNTLAAGGGTGNIILLVQFLLRAKLQAPGSRDLNMVFSTDAPNEETEVVDAFSLTDSSGYAALIAQNGGIQGFPLNPLSGGLWAVEDFSGTNLAFGFKART